RSSGDCCAPSGSLRSESGQTAGLHEPVTPVAPSRVIGVALVGCAEDAAMAVGPALVEVIEPLRDDGRAGRCEDAHAGFQVVVVQVAAREVGRSQDQLGATVTRPLHEELAVALLAVRIAPAHWHARAMEIPGDLAVG